MYSSIVLINEEETDQRDGARYRARGTVNISQNGSQFATADIVNISRSGMAVKCYHAISIGSEYYFNIQGLGEYEGVIVRQFSGNNYGVQFKLNYTGHQRLESRLADLFKTQ